MTPAQFVAKWKRVELTERAASQEHFIDLCRLLGQPTPAEHDATGAEYSFEKGIALTEGGRDRGFADVWWKDKFGWEHKRRGKYATLDEAYRQLCLYREALDNPPLLIVSDIERIEIHTNFTGTKKEVHTIRLDNLAEPRALALLRRVFTDPESFRPQITTERVTQQVAKDLGAIAQRLRDRGHDPHAAAHFLMKCMFCLFAEDVGLLPNELFKKILSGFAREPAELKKRLDALFDAMRTGGAFGVDTIPWFNGGLFDTEPAIELTETEANALVLAANQDWGAVEPAIFGTLFERSLDPDKRSQIGAHYTSREDILLVVEPVIMAPLKAQWEAVKAEVDDQLARRRAAKTPKTRKAADDAINAALQGFVAHLASLRVLDPACGSGNFLYVAIQRLLELEKEVVTYAARPDIGLGLLPRVRPTQLHGIEINPYAAELAQVVIWIGYLQWMRDNGFNVPRDPILAQLQTIENRDAILAWRDEQGQPIPAWREGAACAGAAEWPVAEFIIGNPPFLGSKVFRRSGLPDAYVEAMYASFDLPNTSDLCCYWFELARQSITDGARAPSPGTGAQLYPAGGSRAPEFSQGARAPSPGEPAPSPGEDDQQTRPGAAGLHDLVAQEKAHIWRRNLPHINAEDRPIFLTFCTRDRQELSPDARTAALKHCLHDHRVKLHMHVAVVMPDHVHLLFTPLRDASGVSFGLSEIVQAIKGASAHTVNKLANRRGPVWQEDYFDRIMRSDEDLFEKAQYICNNPVRKGLADSYDKYPWIWLDSQDGARAPSPGTIEKKMQTRPGAAGLHVPLRVGLLATQGIRGGDNRTVLERIVESGVIFMAWSDREWVLDGAAVHVSIVGFAEEHEGDCVLDGEVAPQINSDLSAGEDIASAAMLRENKGVYVRSPEKGAEFDIDLSTSRRLLSAPNPNGRSSLEVVRPWMNGKDMVGGRADKWIIDFHDCATIGDAAGFAIALAYIERVVKPIREKNRDPNLRENWWRFRRSGQEVRDAASTHPRVLGTTMVAKHRLFAWIDAAIQPDKTIPIFARSDDYFFGVLHSSVHELWARRMGTQLREAESGFRYTPTTCFETFPLPWAPRREPEHGARAPSPGMIDQKTRPGAAGLHEAIGAAAHELNEQRERWLNPPEWIAEIEQAIDARDDFADVAAVSGEEARRLIRRSAVQAASAKDPRLKKRTLTNLYNERPTWLRLAHERLDRAVIAAYAAVDPAGEWNPDWAIVWTETGAGQPLPEGHALSAQRAEVDERILANLLRLNQQRGIGGSEGA